MFIKALTKEQAWQKIKHYCAYQERSHSEVKEKLYSYKLKKYEVEALLSQLIDEGYLNEERFARMFAGGKFRMKQWGRKKISYELKQKGISAYNIKKALDEIEHTAYHQTLQKLAATKWKSLKAEQYINRQVKTTNYLMQKGYEPNLIKLVITNLREQ